MTKIRIRIRIPDSNYLSSIFLDGNFLLGLISDENFEYFFVFIPSVFSSKTTWNAVEFLALLSSFGFLSFCLIGGKGSLGSCPSFWFRTDFRSIGFAGSKVNLPEMEIVYEKNWNFFDFSALTFSKDSIVNEFEFQR